MSKFIKIPVPKGYTIKLCSECWYNYDGPYCHKCWNLNDKSDGDYWINRDTPPPIPFHKEPLTENSILQMRIEHLEMELIDTKQEVHDIIKRFEHLL